MNEIPIILKKLVMLRKICPGFERNYLYNLLRTSSYAYTCVHKTYSPTINSNYNSKIQNLAIPIYHPFVV